MAEERNIEKRRREFLFWIKVIALGSLLVGAGTSAFGIWLLFG